MSGSTIDEAQLVKDFELMKDYLKMCMVKEDWHGVMDAAADIREIKAKLKVIAREKYNDEY